MENSEKKEVKITEGWSFMEFVKDVKKAVKCQIGKFVNDDNGDQFSSVILTDASNNRTFIAFSSKMGELTAQQLASKKDSLRVVLTDTNHYILCEEGGNWETVDIF